MLMQQFIILRAIFPKFSTTRFSILQFCYPCRGVIPSCSFINSSSAHSFDDVPKLNSKSNKDKTELFKPEQIPIFDEKWTEEELRLKENAIQKDAWTPIYRYNKIMWIFLIIRSVTAVVAASYCLFFNTFFQKFFELGFEELLTEFTPFLELIIMAHILFYLSRRYLTRLISVVSVDTTKSIYRIGLFTAWGNRRNEYVRAGDFLTLKESNPRGLKDFGKLCWSFKPEDEFLVFPLKDCKIMDDKAINLFLGARPVPYLLQTQLLKRIKEKEKCTSENNLIEGKHQQQ